MTDSATYSLVIPVYNEEQVIPHLLDRLQPAVMQLDGTVEILFVNGGSSDRAALFREVARILKSGGRLYFREPVSNFWPWLMLRAVIYRILTLEHLTERPLRYDETAPYLIEAQVRLISWETYGFFGFCLPMNSDVLIFNRLCA